MLRRRSRGLVLIKAWINKQTVTKPGSRERPATSALESGVVDKTASTNAGCARPLVNVREQGVFQLAFVLATIQSKAAGSRERPATICGVPMEACIPGFLAYAKEVSLRDAGRFDPAHRSTWTGSLMGESARLKIGRGWLNSTPVHQQHIASRRGARAEGKGRISPCLSGHRL